MRKKDATEFLNWLWSYLREEPELEKALNEMLYIERVKLEGDVLEKLEDWE